MHTDLAGINLSSLKKNNRITKAKKPSQKVFSSFSVLQSKAKVLRQENGGKHDWYTGAEENQNPETPGSVQNK